MLFPDLEARVAAVRTRIAAAVERGGHGQQVSIVAVTKTLGADAVAAACAAGIPDIGENRVQEALAKIEATTHPVRWHLIGHLQRNKVKSLGPFTLFHALDSARLADAVSRFGEEQGRAVDVLLQVNASGESSKGGYEAAGVPEEARRLAGHAGIRVKGAMTIARYGASPEELRVTFRQVSDARRALADAGHPATELSMGMSDDFEAAVEEGATIVRLGTVLFGARKSQ